MRMVLGPLPRNRTPRSNASSTTRSRSADACCLVCLSNTSSTPIIRPRPRTSPTRRCFFDQSDIRLIMCLPTSSVLRSKPSRSMTSRVARAAAMQTGLPPNVDACEPGTQSMMSALLTVTPSGMPEAMPFAMQTMSGCTPLCSIAHHFPLRPAPLWTSSATRRMP